MISGDKLLSFSHRAKDGFEKFNCFFIDFLRYNFGRIKVTSRVYTKHNLTDLLFMSIDWFLTGFYFLTDFIYILENHFYFVNPPDYCFKLSLS